MPCLPALFRRLIGPLNLSTSSAVTATPPPSQPSVDFVGLEPLEPRVLLSATVPDGYELIDTISVGTGSDTPTDSVELDAGKQYYAVASGTFNVGTNSAHRADAEYHFHPRDQQWFDLTTLSGENTDMGLRDSSGHLSHWGAHQSDGEYGQSFTAGADAPLELYYQDVPGTNSQGNTYYSDNSGSLTVKLYQQITLDSLTASSEDGSVTTTGGTAGDVLDVVLDDDGLVRLDLTAVVEPAVSEAYAEVNWVVTDGTGSTILSDGAFTGQLESISFDPGLASSYIVKAGVDLNGNDQLDIGEEGHQIPVQMILNMGGEVRNNSNVDIWVSETNLGWVRLPTATWSGQVGVADADAIALPAAVAPDTNNNGVLDVFKISQGIVAFVDPTFQIDWFTNINLFPVEDAVAAAIQVATGGWKDVTVFGHAIVPPGY